jgi:hypothetical protein
MNATAGLVLAALLLASPGAAVADDRAAYMQRRADTDMAAFKRLDRNGDGVLTRDEARGDVYFEPLFDDIDINRDGIITQQEMRGYIERTYGVSPSA